MLFLKRTPLFFLLPLLLLMGCKSTEPVSEEVRPEQEEHSPIALIFDSSTVFSDNFTGFILHDPEKDTTLFQRYADKYFTPASNTKLFTFYAALKQLPDSLPALDYIINGDSLIFWGTGDPTFLHPDFSDTTAYSFLKNTPYELYYSDNHYEDELLGPGWAWGDYQYYYSTEKSPFPMYGNVAEIEIQEISQTKIAENEEGYMIKPEYFRSNIEMAEQRPGKESPFLYRDFNNNTIEYSPKADTIQYTSYRPFHYTPELITNLLSDTLNKKVTYIDRIKPEKVNRLYGNEKDTVLTRMLQPSDNFLAEQLLLNIAAEQNLPMNSGAVIANTSAEFFNDFSKEPVWRDGSGLSRYNMFTPTNMVELLKLIDSEFEKDSLLFRHLPAGGSSGTIRSWYANREGGEPYIFAKTGTLSNNHCLSGYLITRTGRKLIFSFMNNHYITSSSVVKEEMEKVLWFIHQNY
ncbi:D-alanyl-D-alanine carboxypeptidase/D-alanyl-D-alanine-endopeptidase [Gracilimonas sp.]|uniref:D-alanyl-D-alanine carboxypeptidase/D-alanyl-D-alanine-endopeptidase n=1 Tax=Gracilimonas sp. TaxID=1974203 RepID=UPI003D0D82FB